MTDAPRPAAGRHRSPGADIDDTDDTDDTGGTTRAAATPAAVVATASDFSAILPGCPRAGETRARWGTRPAPPPWSHRPRWAR